MVYGMNVGYWTAEALGETVGLPSKDLTSSPLKMRQAEADPGSWPLLSPLLRGCLMDSE